MDLPIYQVAAFTSGAFGGNPAAVVPLDAWIDDALMQRIAAENNLSETAFFVPTGDNEWHIRWFTPAVEVPLCGHATLASAAVIHRQLGHREFPITFHSASGPLIIDTAGDGFKLDLPANPPVPVPLPAGLDEAMGAPSLECRVGRDIWMLVYDDESVVRGLAPDFPAVAKIVEHGIIATAPGNEIDFVSRFFAPAIGIDEDPVTGAAHCVLTPYWSARLGKTSMRAQQVSARLGDLACELAEDRVRLTGNAVFFLSGTITV
jgi:predicted PhzF superfamily epimerase YddE/YHI9